MGFEGFGVVGIEESGGRWGKVSKRNKNAYHGQSIDRYSRTNLPLFREALGVWGAEGAIITMHFLVRQNSTSLLLDNISKR